MRTREKRIRDLVAKERNDEKRQLYADFFMGIALSPGDYDKREKVLKLLEGVDPNQMRVLKAMTEPLQQLLGSWVHSVRHSSAEPDFLNKN